MHNLNRAFNALLAELDLKIGADGRTRTLYSFRHFYATLNLERGVNTHALSRQLGNSTEMKSENICIRFTFNVNLISIMHAWTVHI